MIKQKPGTDEGHTTGTCAPSPGAVAADGQNTKKFETEERFYPPRLPEETRMAYRAFQSFLARGGLEKPEALVGMVGASPQTLRRWYQKHEWLKRMQDMTTAQGEAVLRSGRERADQAVAEWQARREELRATEWSLHLALVEAGQTALEDLAAGTSGKPLAPADLARLIDLASRLGRLATGMATSATESGGLVSSALHVDIEVALKRVYGHEKQPAIDVGGNVTAETQRGGK